ncbi:Anhydromuramoyl-peptide exo-beta-N-acetylglucosaminidase (EC 3.2.1.-) [Mycetohabitans rhizoxinica HKI 454]|uniref:Beta-hexosaminidase n=2 Tax=Burkholderiaceae TaxID=119060 RepID=E5ANZ3_MYCRK|nr:Anhydromuramoyl-peptide exo-beta-N-acetylglucosaminidase (EC 3.2.1.-) [Mycetohabitans rhizoxinica HKI 454]
MNNRKCQYGPVMFDVAGTSLSRDDVRRIADPLTGGVILFARNYASRAQLLELTGAIRDVRDDVIIAVDQEGGRVQRFREDGFTSLPPMRVLGALWNDDALAAIRVATAIGYVMASELRASGLDLSFAPVLDLDYGHAKAIGDRAFHADPRVVALLAKSVAHGLALAGMAACGKHFPGHGYVEADSHVEAPVDTRALDEILGCDAQPYQWLGLSLAAVMPAHVVYPAVDARPAGFSGVWLQQILRGRLGFNGVIFSDDLSMEAARQAGTTAEAAHAALDAGCDMVLVCNRPEDADDVLQRLRARVIDTASRRRIKRLAPRGGAPKWSELMRQPDYCQARELIDSLR